MAFVACRKSDRLLSAARWRRCAEVNRPTGSHLISGPSRQHDSKQFVQGNRLTPEKMHVCCLPCCRQKTAVRPAQKPFLHSVLRLPKILCGLRFQPICMGMGKVIKSPTPSTNSGIWDNHRRGNVANFLGTKLQIGSRSPCCSIAKNSPCRASFVIIRRHADADLKRPL